MRSLFILCTFFLPIASAQIAVDGDASEWTGALPGVDNTSVYRVATAGQSTKLNEWIWQDATSDHRTDLSPTGNDDLLEVRLASDTSFLYYMFKITPGFTFQPMLQISLRLPSSSSTQTSLGGFSETQVPADAAWDYLLMTQNGGTSNLIYNSSWSTQASGTGAVSSSNGVIEGRVPWSSLGGSPNGGSYRVTITSYRESGGNTVDVYLSNCLDLVTATATTWGAVSSGTIDYSTSIVFRTDNQVLPVELISFDARRSPTAIQVSWSTATETRNAGFDLERRTGENGVFRGIAFLPGAGTSSVPRSYSYEDRQAGNGLVEYRLKQIDSDGTVHFSPVVAVDAVGVASDLQCYPNPFNPSTTVHYGLASAQRVKIAVYDLLGRVLKVLVDEDQAAGTHSVRWDATGASAGVYICQFESGDQRVMKRLVLLK